jgi:hypothetical protein
MQFSSRLALSCLSYSESRAGQFGSSKEDQCWPVSLDGVFLSNDSSKVTLPGRRSPSVNVSDDRLLRITDGLLQTNLDKPTSFTYLAFLHQLTLLCNEVVLMLCINYYAFLYSNRSGGFVFFCIFWACSEMQSFETLAYQIISKLLF